MWAVTNVRLNSYYVVYNRPRIHQRCAQATGKLSLLLTCVHWESCFSDSEGDCYLKADELIPPPHADETQPDADATQPDYDATQPVM